MRGYHVILNHARTTTGLHRFGYARRLKKSNSELFALFIGFSFYF